MQSRKAAFAGVSDQFPCFTPLEVGLVAAQASAAFVDVEDGGLPAVLGHSFSYLPTRLTSPPAVPVRMTSPVAAAGKRREPTTP